LISYTESEMEYVASKDKIMSRLIDHYGHIDRGKNTDIFSSLVEHIIGQLLSNKAAKVLNNRFRNKFEEITAERLAPITVDELRSCGISRPKATAIHELSNGVISGKYDFSSLKSMSDEEVVQYLMQIKGVGRWTAEMIAEFTLGRLNIFCYQDVALKNGIIKAHGFNTLSELRFNRLKKKYSPYTTVASLYYYELNDDDSAYLPR